MIVNYKLNWPSLYKQYVVGSVVCFKILFFRQECIRLSEGQQLRAVPPGARAQYGLRALFVCQLHSHSQEQLLLIIIKNY